MKRTVPVSEVASDLQDLLQRVERGEQVVIKDRGRRRAVIVDYNELRTLQEVAHLVRDPASESWYSTSRLDA